jgi:hypothetical protein
MNDEKRVILFGSVFCFTPFFTPAKNVNGAISKDYRGKCRLRAYITKHIDGTTITPIEVGTPVVITAIQPHHIGDPSKHSMCSGIGITELWNDEFVLVDEI